MVFYGMDPNLKTLQTIKLVEQIKLMLKPVYFKFFYRNKFVRTRPDTTGSGSTSRIKPDSLLLSIQ